LSINYVTRALLAKALAAFKGYGWKLPTGAGGMSRKELRLLERKGLIESRLERLNSGTTIRVWKWVGPR
jgi:hypothetical protein